MHIYTLTHICTYIYTLVCVYYDYVYVCTFRVYVWIYIYTHLQTYRFILHTPTPNRKREAEPFLTSQRGSWEHLITRSEEWSCFLGCSFYSVASSSCWVNTEDVVLTPFFYYYTLGWTSVKPIEHKSFFISALRQASTGVCVCVGVLVWMWDSL